MKHKHCDVIKAWADGVEIQQRHPVDPTYWENIEKYPSWSDGMEYRIKPKTITYRLWLELNDGGSPKVKTTHSYEEKVNFRADFGKWLSDWQEVEV